MQKLKAKDIIYLSESVIRNLNQNRILTLVEFLQEDISKLATITKLTLPQILAIRNEIFEKYSAPVKNGPALLEKCLARSRYLCTGIERLDAALEGGIPKGYMTEICGLADSGKTQLCFQLAINCAVTNNSVLYIDTKGDFSAVHIQKILDASGFSHKEMAVIMCKIRVVRVWTMDELMELFQQLKQKLIQIEDLALIIIDSLPCLMLQFLGDDNKTGLKFLNILVNYSRYLMNELNIGIICVNIQTRWVEQDAIDFEDEQVHYGIAKETYNEKKNRCLGRYWQHIPYLVLQLEKTQENKDMEQNIQIILSIVKSKVNIPIDCCLNITDLGVCPTTPSNNEQRDINRVFDCIQNILLQIMAILQGNSIDR